LSSADAHAAGVFLMNRIFRLVVPMCLFVVSCQLGDTLSLEVLDNDPRFSRINARLPVTIRPETATVFCSANSCTAAEFRELVYQGCIGTLTPMSRTTGNTCAAAAVTADQEVCTAHLLLTVVEAAAPVRMFLRNAAGTLSSQVLVPPQDSETNAALAVEAAGRAGRALTAIGDALPPPPTAAPCTDANLTASAGTVNAPPALQALTVVEELARFYDESLNLIEDSAQAAAEHGSAVSEVELSRAGDLAEAAFQAFSPAASRGAAAHMLVGGSHGFPASFPPNLMQSLSATDGFFTRRPPRGEARAALDLLRTAAQNPTWITSTSISIDQLVDGGGAVGVHGSVRERVGLFRGRRALYESATATSTFELLGASRSAFVEARDFLREELRAFDRTENFTLPAERLANGVLTSAAVTSTNVAAPITLYAATRNPPTQSLPTYWSAALRYDLSPALLAAGLTDYNMPPTWTWRPNTAGSFPAGHSWGDELPDLATPGLVLSTSSRTVASMLGDALGRGPEILTRLCVGGGATCNLTATTPVDLTRLARARDVFARALSRFGGAPAVPGSATPTLPELNYNTATSLGRARACVFGVSPSYDVRIDLLTPIPSSNLVVVRGREGLECAVRGTVDGVPCNQLFFDSVDDPGPFVPGSGAGVVTQRVPSVSFGRPNVNATALFVVRLRPGSTTRTPGAYDEVTGFVLTKPAGTTGYQYCTTHPILPLIERQAATVFAPDPHGAPGAEEYCAGISRNIRIPLENELTSDGTPEESSWRHYLELARRSGEESNALGEDLVRTGLEMDLRAEAASDELSRLCGVRINLSSITNALSSGLLGAVATGMPPCSAPYVAQDTRCVLDPVLYAASQAAADEDMRRLASCIGAEVVPWSTLGDVALCLWDATPGASMTVTPSEGICAGATRDMPCPFDADTNGSCGTGPVPSGAVRIAVSERMGIFRRPSDIVALPPDPQDLPCEALARLRAGRPLPTDAAELRETPILTYETISWLANQLTWEPTVGDYSVVRYGGAQVFTTGNIATGVGAIWPMGPRPASPDSTCPGGLTPPPSTAFGLAGWTNSLFCLENFAAASDEPGADRAVRSRWNDLLARAVFALRTWSGLDLGDSRIPFYTDGYSHQFYDQATFAWSSLGGTSPGGVAVTGHCAETGSFFRDSSGTDCCDSGSAVDSAELGSRACIVDAVTGSACGTGAVPAYAEWSRCPYDGGPCRIFADETALAGDCDDPPLGAPAPLDPTRSNISPSLAVFSATPGADYDVPMLIVAPANDRTTYPEARRDAMALWNDTTEAGLPALFRIASTRSTITLRRPIDANFPSLFFDSPDQSASYVNRALPGRSSPTGFERGRSLSYLDLLNGVELACVAARQGLPATTTSCSEPSGINSLADALRLAAYFECRSNEISLRNSRSVVRNLPRRVVDALAQDGIGVYGSGAGEIDAEVSEIRAALIELSTNQSAMAGDLRSFATTVRGLRSAVASSTRMREIEQLTALSGRLDRITQCATAIATIATTDGAGAAGRAAGAAVTCLNSVGQIIIGDQISRLRTANIEDSVIQLFVNFDLTASGLGTTLEGRAVGIRAALERIDASLARLRANQMQARQALARALGLSDAGAGAHNAVNSVYRARYNTLLTRYRNAHRRAVRSAFIARVALEQRLGMSLADIDDDLFSDEAPREWVDTICTLPSIDYDALRGSDPGTTGGRGMDPGLIAPDGYAGTFVGDYVRRLEDVFESYSFVHPFQAGTDTAVISLRDDILGTRAECEVASPNLVLNGGRLDRLANEEHGGWEVVGCNPGAVAEPIPPARANRRCVSVAPVAGVSARVTGGLAPTGTVLAGDFGTPPPYSVSFGGSAAWVAGAALQQSVPVSAGRYRLSWFASGGSGILAADAVRLTGASLVAAMPPEAVGTWTRHWAFYDVADDGVVAVRLTGGPTTSSSVTTSILVTGVMLENLSDGAGDPSLGVPDPRPVLPPTPLGPATVSYGSVAAPAPFVESGDFGTRTVRACADSDGRWFQREAFVPGCVRTCVDGYDGRCPAEYQEVRCFRETTFSISADELQELLVAGDAGFAAGNFNYRIESVGINLVGDGLRDCESTGGSSGCYASGTFSYSILHGGPYFVRNAVGSVYEAPLFPGRIESARALAAERYLTNPLSSADRGLIDPFTRFELRGRPLHGSLSLRIWDDPRFVFSNLEDIQIVLNYRYWTHQR
jgi:hypothetical protein